MNIESQTMMEIFIYNLTMYTCIVRESIFIYALFYTVKEYMLYTMLLIPTYLPFFFILLATH